MTSLSDVKEKIGDGVDNKCSRKSRSPKVKKSVKL